MNPMTMSKRAPAARKQLMHACNREASYMPLNTICHKPLLRNYKDVPTPPFVKSN